MEADALYLFLSAAKLVEAESFVEIETALNDVLEHCKCIAQEKFSALAAGHVHMIRSDLHDEAIQAQGGL